MPKHAQARPSMHKHSEQLLGTHENLLNLKKHKIFDLKIAVYICYIYIYAGRTTPDNPRRKTMQNHEKRHKTMQNHTKPS